LLFKIAEAACRQPQGTVRDGVSPAAGGASVLAAIVREIKRPVVSSARCIRCCAPPIWAITGACCRPCLGVLEFRSNNVMHRPVMDAIYWLRRTGDDGRRIIRPEGGVPIEGVVPAKWRDLIVEEGTAGGMRVSRASDAAVRDPVVQQPVGRLAEVGGESSFAISLREMQ
jgi:hypothetical protein